jgi:regulator of protease activity HflC (stomatin/prohibitin superfamily)
MEALLDDPVGLFLLVLVILVIILLIAAVNIVKQYERGVIFQFGKVLSGAKGPGLFLIIPIIDKMEKVNLQIVTMNVPQQDVITRDNVTVRVDAVVYFKVVEPIKAVVEVQNYLFATSQVCQTTLRSVCGTAELDELLSERERLNNEIQQVVDDLTEPWGVKVTLVEIRDVVLPSEIQRAMARQAEAERDRRARIIGAEGEFQAAAKLSEAAAVIARHPIAYQLRMLQTMVDVAGEQNSTLVFPIPVELLGPFQSAFSQPHGDEHGRPVVPDTGVPESLRSEGDGAGGDDGSGGSGDGGSDDGGPDGGAGGGPEGGDDGGEGPNPPTPPVDRI